MVVGHSFYKPGITALAGELVVATGREQRFLWLHLATNIGGMTGPLFAERARIHDGWHGVFVCSTAAMALGTFLFLVRPRSAQGIPYAGSRRAVPSRSFTLEREQIRAVWLVCGIAVVFWLTAQQAGSSLTLFAEAHTHRYLTFGAWAISIGPGHFVSLHSLLVLLLLPPFINASRCLRGRGAAPSIPAKMIWGYVATAGAFVVMGAACLRGGDAGRVHVGWLASCYLLLSVAEVQLAPLGLALVTQLAPPGKMSCAVGLWFASVALGNGLTGALGLLWGRWPIHRYFALLALLSIGAASTLWMRLQQMEALIQRTSSSFENINPL